MSRFWVTRVEPLRHISDALTNDIVLVRGPAGIGKTALLRQFAATVEADPELGVLHIDGSLTTPASLPLILDAFAGGPPAHLLLIDNHVDGAGLSTDHLLRLLRADDRLRIVVATRQVTGLESPLVALEFDVQVISARDLSMTRDEVAAVVALNGVESTEDAIAEFAERADGWPALVQLASARLRLEGLAPRTREDAISAASFAEAALTNEMEQRVTVPVTDDVRLLAVASYVTEPVADALGLGSVAGTAGGLLLQLQNAGLVWPSATRLVLAEPVRRHWLRDLIARRPGLVAETRLRLLEHLTVGGEPVFAAQMAADAEQWSALARVLRRSGPEIWACNAESFTRMVRLLRQDAPASPLVVEALVTLDPETASSPATPGLVVSALGQLPDAKCSAASDVRSLIVRVSLLRAAGRFTLAAEVATLLTRALRRTKNIDPETIAEAWYQTGMTSFATGMLRDASVALTGSESRASPAGRLRIRGALSVIALVQGDVGRARSIIDDSRDDRWLDSPWGEGLRLASAWMALEDGDAVTARELFDDLPATAGARELWPFAASAHVVSSLLSGTASDALAILRTWMARALSTPPSHYQSVQLVTSRAKVLIALRQTRKALALFEGPFGLSPTTAPTIALSLLHAGRAHEAFVMSVKWGMHHEPYPRAALESLVVSVIADARLNGSSAHRTAARRAEALSNRHGLWSPWSAVSPEDREIVRKILSPPSREHLDAGGSLFASSVSVPRLTTREQIVLSHLNLTSTIAEIAEELVVSPNTVKTQLQSLYRKLQVSDRSSAIRAGLAWGLIETDPEVRRDGRGADGENVRPPAERP